MVLVILFLSFIITLFVTRKYFLIQKQNDFNDLSFIYTWRNQRADLVLNTKKWIFKYQSNELIENKTLTYWVETTI